MGPLNYRTWSPYALSKLQPKLPDHHRPQVQWTLMSHWQRREPDEPKKIIWFCSTAHSLPFLLPWLLLWTCPRPRGSFCPQSPSVPIAIIITQRVVGCKLESFWILSHLDHIVHAHPQPVGPLISLQISYWIWMSPQFVHESWVKCIALHSCHLNYTVVAFFTGEGN